MLVHQRVYSYPFDPNNDTQRFRTPDAGPLTAQQAFADRLALAVQLRIIQRLPWSGYWGTSNMSSVNKHICTYTLIYTFYIYIPSGELT